MAKEKEKLNKYMKIKEFQGKVFSLQKKVRKWCSKLID